MINVIYTHLMHLMQYEYGYQFMYFAMDILLHIAMAYTSNLIFVAELFTQRR